MRGSSDAGLKTLVAVLIILMIGNVLMLARSVELLRFPGEITDTEIVRGGARVLAGHYEKTIADAGLARNSAVRDALAKFKFEIEQAASGEEISHSIWTYGRAVQDVIAREEENQRRELVLWVINQDPATKEVADRASVAITRGKEGNIEVEARDIRFSEATLARLRGDQAISKLAQPVEIEIAGGKASLVTPRTIQDALKLLQAEVASLRSSLENLRRVSGHGQLEGHGIVVRVYDAPRGYSREEIVQEKDIRDMINELFAAGAMGIEVGGQRLVATSSVRSAGPLLLVNQQPIPVNPVVIRAVGDPALLESSLELLRNSLKPWGIRIEVEREDNVVLTGFRREGL